MIKFTSDQLAAIKCDGSVIVSAGAGCGKTATMIERVVNKLKAGAELESMLIVTFTRASAADIRVKLCERLTALKTEDGGAYRRIADAAISAMPECNIGTLHGFCQRLIKTYFYAAGIDPSAVLVEENEARLIKTVAVKEAVDSSIGNVDGFDEMRDALCTRRDDRGITDVIGEIVDFALSTEDPYGYLERGKSAEEYEAEIETVLEARKQALKDKADVLREEVARIGFKELLGAADSIDAYLDGKIDEFDGTRYTPKKTDDGGEVAVKREINERYKSLKADCKKLREFEREAEQAKARDGSKYKRALCAVAKNALDRFAAKKARLGKIDYSDLEHGAKRVLSDDGCRSEIAARIKYVFIDEFQDVNPLQAAIADSLKDCGAEMFLVGDIKQSIYGFRRCSPEFFRRKFNDAKNGYTKVSLTENHRSSRAVIDFVNGVFDGLMKENYGGADYSECKLVCASDRTGDAEFCLVEPSDAEDAEERSDEARVYSVIAANEYSSVDPEAIAVARMIGEYIKNRNGKEKFGLGSIAVLVRSARGTFVSDLVDILSASGIPCNVGRKTKLSDYPEAVALLDIARCVDDSRDDIALYTALRSPMGGFGDEELAEISCTGEEILKASDSGNGGFPFRLRVKAYRGELRDRLDAFFALRDKFKIYSACHNAADTLGFITSEIAYFAHVYENYGAASGGAVQALIQAASDRRCELHSFITYCDKTDFEPNVEIGDDAVNIMTIHASKGLEFDYCIVADTAREFMMRELHERVIVSENGVAVKVPTSEDGRLKLKPSIQHLAESLRGDRLREEELRLFYVALTRAKCKLTVCGKRRERSDKDKRELDFMRDTPYKLVDATALEKVEEPTYPKTDGSAIEVAVKNICEFDYGERSGGGKPIKTCVTAIAADADSDDYTFAAPVVYDEYAADYKPKNGVPPEVRGTAYHRAMELIDFAAPDFSKVAPMLDDPSIVDGGDIERAAAAMKKLAEGASFCFKERYFIADFDGTLVQGVIDLLIVHPDGTCDVIDYKTTSPRFIDNAAYRKQLDMYARAVEKTSPYRVKHRYIYSFAVGLIEFPPENSD